MIALRKDWDERNHDKVGGKEALSEFQCLQYTVSLTAKTLETQLSSETVSLAFFQLNKNGSFLAVGRPLPSILALLGMGGRSPSPYIKNLARPWRNREHN